MATFCESPPKPCSQVRPSTSRGRLNSISGSPIEMRAGEVDMTLQVSHGAFPRSTLIEEDAMAEQDAKASGPDLSQGVALTELADGGLLLGHVGEEEVVVVRHGSEVFAIAAHCSHYHGPLAEGLVVGDTVHCPWHHARFSLRTGEAVAAPAISPIECWSVEQRDGKVFVKAKKAAPTKPKPKVSGKAPDKIVIVGGGAAGFAAAEMLRREQYSGSIVMLSDDAAAPVDRPNLSKDYLAGNAPEEWVPLRGDDFYADNKIDLRLET